MRLHTTLSRDCACVVAYMKRESFAWPQFDISITVTGLHSTYLLQPSQMRLCLEYDVNVVAHPHITQFCRRLARSDNRFFHIHLFTRFFCISHSPPHEAKRIADLPRVYAQWIVRERIGSEHEGVRRRCDVSRAHVIRHTQHTGDLSNVRVLLDLFQWYYALQARLLQS